MEIIHVDEAVLVIDKPAGLAVLPDGWERDAPYAVRLLEEQFQEPAGGSGKAIWIVHRLDKSTSGVMVFARTAQAHRDLNRQFELREARKIYHAIIEGLPDWDEKSARQPLRVNVGHKHRTAVDARRGKPSETLFRVLRRFAGCALVEAELMTGRTHQIRAHAYALGHPLLGDVLYGGQPSDLIARPALHAYQLTIRNPSSGEIESYTAPYPRDFQDVLERLGA